MMTEQKRFPWLAVILGVGCVGVLCIGVLLVGGGLVYFSDLNIVLPAAPALTQPVATILAPSISVQPSQPTNPPEEPTLVPSPAAAPTDSGLPLTGDQRLDDHSLFEDFSSEALGWPVVDDGKTILKYENQAYSFQVTERDYYDWAYIPANFIPYEIRFDVKGPPGLQDGTFGVFCQFQDADNYYYAEFDLYDNTYTLGQYLQGEFTPLKEQNATGDYWYSSNALKSPATSVNRIGISCYLDSITLFINDQWVDEVNVAQSFDVPGEAAFFVYAFDNADEDGYKVFFDNVEVWQPVQ